MPFRYPPLVLLPVLALLMVAQVAAESGPCRYDPKQCSCAHNPQGGGVCWSRKSGSPSICLRRKCRGGWSCQCAGRTHVCSIREVVVYTPSNPMEATQLEAPCETKPRSVVNSTDIELGFTLVTISHDGLLANDCTRFAIYHNGALLASFGTVPGISDKTVAKEQQDRAFHDKLELRPGDSLAFRFLQSSYYCFGNSIVLSHHAAFYVVNPADSPMFEAYYARAESPGWNTKELEMSPSNTRPDEASAGASNWIPLRTHKLSAPHEQIASGIDYWKPRNEANADDRRGDWYFRMKIPQPRAGQETGLI